MPLSTTESYLSECILWMYISPMKVEMRNAPKVLSREGGCGIAEDMSGSAGVALTCTRGTSVTRDIVSGTPIPLPSMLSS